MNENDLLAEKLLASDELVPESVDAHCHFASILYYYGVRKQKGRPFLLALNHLMQAEELDCRLSPSIRHLWGNVLSQLGKLVHDYSFFEKAIIQYAKAAEASEHNPKLYWDWADTWLQLGHRSGEETDLKRALEMFSKANCKDPLFSIDYANAYAIYGVHTGDPSFLEQALSILRGVIADTYDVEGETTLEYEQAWRTYAAVCKQRFELTHLPSHFEEAETSFQEAILSVPSNAELWLDWGALYISGGWLKHDSKLIETALDKLTSSKAKEGDHLRLSALLGKGLILLGLFIEDLKLIREGEERVKAALELAPHHPELLNAAAYLEFALGIYFSDAKGFERAAVLFEEGVQADASSVPDWHGLFQTYVSWGMMSEDAVLLKAGIEAIARICQLRPHSSLHLNEWGVGLLQLRQLVDDLDDQAVVIEEAALKFKQAFALCEDLETVYHWGCALDQMGDISGDESDYEKAISLLTTVYEYNPNEPHVCYHLGLAYSHLGELTAEVEFLFRSVELLTPLAESDPEDSTLWGDLGYAFLNISEIVYDSFQPEKAEEYRRSAEKYLLHAVEIGNGDANYHLACLYSLANLVESSIHFLRRAKAIDVLPPLDDLEHDEWLANVRNSDLYKEIL